MLSNAALPAVIALVVHMLSVVLFSLCEGKKNYKKKEKYHIWLKVGHRVSPVIEQ